MIEKELREIDAWIATTIFGWQQFREEEHPHRMLWREGETGTPVWDEADFYTTDPGAAMWVLEKCLDRCDVRIVKVPSGFRIDRQDVKPNLCCTFAETLPLAIALFAKELYSK